MYIVKLQDQYGNEFAKVIDAPKVRIDGTTLVLSDHNESKIVAAFKSWISVESAEGTKQEIENDLREVAHIKRKSTKKA